MRGVYAKRLCLQMKDARAEGAALMIQRNWRGSIARDEAVMQQVAIIMCQVSLRIPLRNELLQGRAINSHLVSCDVMQSWVRCVFARRLCSKMRDGAATAIQRIWRGTMGRDEAFLRQIEIVICQVCPSNFHPIIDNMISLSSLSIYFESCRVSFDGSFLKPNIRETFESIERYGQFSVLGVHTFFAAIAM